MCLGTFSRLRRSLTTSTLYIAVCILAKRFLLTGTQFPVKRKNPLNHISGFRGFSSVYVTSIPHSRHNAQRSKSVSKTPSGVFIVRIPRLKLSSETVI